MAPSGQFGSKIKMLIIHYLWIKIVHIIIYSCLTDGGILPQENKLKRSLLSLISVLVLTGCSSLSSIAYTPTQTAQSWLTLQPYVEFQIASKTVVLVQPTTTTLVYLLGLVAIGAGLYFFRIQKGQRSRVWWGIALVLWGIGALFAGTSYEAFSYQLKCVGREVCAWTSWLEVVYLVLSVASLNAMLMAEAYACATGKLRKILIGYAVASMAVYLVAAAIGSLVPLQFLISFDLLILVGAPNLVIFLVLNGWRYSQLKRRMDLALLGTWAWLVLTIGAYFLYYLSGLSQKLWQQGHWFTENDVLHIGLILWMVYIMRVVAHRVEDKPEHPSIIPEAVVNNSANAH